MRENIERQRVEGDRERLALDMVGTMAKLLDRNLEGAREIRAQFSSSRIRDGKCDDVKCGAKRMLAPQLESSAFVQLCCLGRESSLHANGPLKKPVIETPFLL